MGNLLTVCVGEDEDKKYAKLFTEKYKVPSLHPARTRARECIQCERLIMLWG